MGGQIWRRTSGKRLARIPPPLVATRGQVEPYSAPRPGGAIRRPTTPPMPPSRVEMRPWRGTVIATTRGEIRCGGSVWGGTRGARLAKILPLPLWVGTLGPSSTLAPPFRGAGSSAGWWGITEQHSASTCPPGRRAPQDPPRLRQRSSNRRHPSTCSVHPAKGAA